MKLLYVIGYGRSGSTILGNILGELPGVVHVGELRTIWGLGLLEGRMCGCGVPVRECEFWRAVLKAGFGEPLREDPRRVLTAQRESMRLRNTMRILRQAPGRHTDWPALDAYARVADRLYCSIGDVTGARVIVDSSKRQAEAALLHLLPNVDPYYIQLIRDPRAVAFSWQRVKASPGEGKRGLMRQHGPLITGRNWASLNYAAEAVRRKAGVGRSTVVRYEDLVAAPMPTIERITTLIGERPEGLPFLDDHTVQLGGNHTAGGNPGRLSGGPTTIRIDDEWVSRQRPGPRLVATTFALPLLHRYDYPLRPKATST